MKAEAAGPQWLQIFRRSSHFRIAPFDERAAVEHAARQRRRTSSPSGRAPVSRPKAKFDEQIIAIAAVEQAEIIYSDDPDIARRVTDGVRAIGIAELPLPPEGLQPDLPSPPPNPTQMGALTCRTMNRKRVEQHLRRSGVIGNEAAAPARPERRSTLSGSVG